MLEVLETADDEVEVTLCLPDYAVTLNASARSPGLGNVAYFLLNSLMVHQTDKNSHFFNGEISDFIENYAS